MSKLIVAVLAAGQGKRMCSHLPKVLHRLANRPLLEHVVSAASRLSPSRIFVVYGHGGEAVPNALSHLDVTWVLQAEQRGTGHAVQQIMPEVPDDAQVLVLYGDVPLIGEDTLKAVIGGLGERRICLLTVCLPDPSGYGRVIRGDDGSIRAIVEERDASESERKITEVNTGVMALPASALRQWLRALRPDNTQGEHYLTDVIGMAVGEGALVHGILASVPEEVMGVNDRAQLAHLERHYQLGLAHELMRGGVSLMDPARIDIRGIVIAGRDVIIDVNVVLEGVVKLGDGVRIGANVSIKSCEIGPGTEILPHCVIDGAVIGAQCKVGPFSRIRPETRLHEHVHLGNFVEVKRSVIAQRSKVNHLSYIGDSDIGKNVNIGAGTITCNYDGAAKHKTTIGDGAFIGSGTELVAPVRIAPGSMIGAGSTITRDTAPDTLTVARSKQVVVKGWKRPEKGK